MQKPFYQLEHHHEVIRQFTPNWFTMTMGTGVVALILSEFSFVHEWFWSVGAGLWQFNTILFCVFSLLYLLRWLILPIK